MALHQKAFLSCQGHNLWVSTQLTHHKSCPWVIQECESVVTRSQDKGIWEQCNRDPKPEQSPHRWLVVKSYQDDWQLFQPHCLQKRKNEASQHDCAEQFTWPWSRSKWLNLLSRLMRRWNQCEQWVSRWAVGGFIPALKPIANLLQSHEILFVLKRGSLWPLARFHCFPPSSVTNPLCQYVLKQVLKKLQLCSWTDQCFPYMHLFVTAHHKQITTHHILFFTLPIQPRHARAAHICVLFMFSSFLGCLTTFYWAV